MSASPPPPTTLAALVPGRPATFLAVILGIRGPTAYVTTDGSTSYRAHLVVADHTRPLGVPLVFFGRAILAVAHLPPLRPLLFTDLDVTPADPASGRDLALRWNAAPRRRSTVAPPASPSPAVDALTRWAAAAFGDLARRATLPVALPAPPTTATTATVTAGAPPRKHMGVLVAVDVRGVVAAGTRCVVRARVVEARLPRPRAQRGAGVLGADVIQALVGDRCAAGGDAERGGGGAAARMVDIVPEPGWRRPHAHCAGCLVDEYDAFYVRVVGEGEGEGGSAGDWCLVRGRAVERLFLGVRAADARADIAAAGRAADALADLVREEGPFALLLAPIEDGWDAGNAMGRKRVLVELVDLFV